MYPKHKTEAIILKRYSLREDDIAFVLLSKEFGLIHARAVSLRKQESKLKYVLADNLIIDATLIQAKSGWKIVEAQEPDEVLAGSSLDLEKLKFAGSYFKFLLNFVPSNESDERLFQISKAYLLSVKSCQDSSQLKFINILAMHDILFILGYLDASRLILLEEENFELVDISSISQKVNSAVKNSQINYKLEF